MLSDGFKIINPGESNSLDTRISSFVQEILDLEGPIIYDKVIKGEIVIEGINDGESEI